MHVTYLHMLHIYACIYFRNMYIMGIDSFSLRNVLFKKKLIKDVFMKLVNCRLEMPSFLVGYNKQLLCFPILVLKSGFPSTWGLYWSVRLLKNLPHSEKLLLRIFWTFPFYGWIDVALIFFMDPVCQKNYLIFPIWSSLVQTIYLYSLAT